MSPDQSVIGDRVSGVEGPWAIAGVDGAWVRLLSSVSEEGIELDVGGISEAAAGAAGAETMIAVEVEAGEVMESASGAAVGIGSKALTSAGAGAGVVRGILAARGAAFEGPAEEGAEEGAIPTRPNHQRHIPVNTTAQHTCRCKDVDSDWGRGRGRGSERTCGDKGSSV